MSDNAQNTTEQRQYEVERAFLLIECLVYFDSFPGVIMRN